MAVLAKLSALTASPAQNFPSVSAAGHNQTKPPGMSHSKEKSSA